MSSSVIKLRSGCQTSSRVDFAAAAIPSLTINLVHILVLSLLLDLPYKQQQNKHIS